MADLTSTAMNSYNWKINSFGKKISAEDAVRELERITVIYGKLTPEIIVKESMKQNSVLHSLFEWDNDKAAFNYRLQQARQLINNIEVKIIKNGGETILSNYEVVNIGNGNNYKSVDVLDSDDIEFIRQSTRRQLAVLKQKLSLYDNFKKLIIHLNAAIESV